MDNRTHYVSLRQKSRLFTKDKLPHLALALLGKYQGKVFVSMYDSKGQSGALFYGDGVDLAVPSSVWVRITPLLMSDTLTPSLNAPLETQDTYEVGLFDDVLSPTERGHYRRILSILRVTLPDLPEFKEG